MDPDVNAKPAIRNKTWAELNVGDAASLERTCSTQDLVLFAHVSGNVNPLMLPPVENGAENSRPVAPSMWVSWLISAVLGNVLPGARTLYRGQDLRFPHRVHVGDKLKVTVVRRISGKSRSPSSKPASRTNTGGLSARERRKSTRQPRPS
jgi:acyl dehydratase